MEIKNSKAVSYTHLDVYKRQYYRITVAYVQFYLIKIAETNNCRTNTKYFQDNPLIFLIKFCKHMIIL